MFDLGIVFLFSGVVQDPNVEVFALGFFDDLDEVVGGEGFKNFIDHNWRVVGSFFYIVFGGGVLLDEIVDSSVVFGEDGCENSMDSLFLLLGFRLHIKRRLNYKMKDYKDERFFSYRIMTLI